MKRLVATLILLLPLAACSRTSDGSVEMRMAPLTLPTLPKLKTPDLTALWPQRAAPAPAADVFPEPPPPPQAGPTQPARKAVAGSAAKPKAATTRRKAPQRAQKAKPVVKAKAERPLACAQAVEVDGRVRMDCR